MAKIFTPHELKTIEVDSEKKTFKINGEDFGEGCTGFLISCTPDDFHIRVEVDTTVHFANYSDKGKLRKQESYTTNDSWFGQNGSDKQRKLTNTVRDSSTERGD